MRLLLASLLWCAIPAFAPVLGAEPPVRSLEARAREASSDRATALLVAESFASFADARAYVAKVRQDNGIDLAQAFGPYGYDVAYARNFLSVAASERRLLTDQNVELGRWIMPFLCIDKDSPERAHAAAKALGLVEKGVDDQYWCIRVAWSKPVRREAVGYLTKRVASAGYSKDLRLQIEDVVIVLGKALTGAERSKLERLAKEHHVPVRALQSAYWESE